MNERAILGLVLAITISLVGLVTIQVGWIKDAKSLRDQQYAQSIDNALIAVSDRLERIDRLQGLQDLDAGRAIMDQVNAQEGVLSTDPGMSTDPLLQERDLVAEMLRGMLSGPSEASITERVDPRLLDSLMVEELGLRGIDAPFRYAVMDEQGTVSIPIQGAGSSTDDLKRSPHRVRLFRHEVVDS
ncbi:MAG: hypothetical protein KDB88_13610, partial [Flavobacteriales bacterium]|nr:hypothetical protein [Flavobacteriales bacterium]